MSDYMSRDIHDNLVSVGDCVYVMATPSPGSKYKRLFHAEVQEIKKSGLITAQCTENQRVVNVFGTSCVKPYPRGMFVQEVLS